MAVARDIIYPSNSIFQADSSEQQFGVGTCTTVMRNFRNYHQVIPCFAKRVVDSRYGHERPTPIPGQSNSQYLLRVLEDPRNVGIKHIDVRRFTGVTPR